MATTYLNAAGKGLVTSAWGANQVKLDAILHSAVGTAAADSLFDDTNGAVLTGGKGDDTYFIVSSKSTIVESAGEGTDTAVIYDHFTLPANVENMQIGGNNIVGTGNALDNIIITTGSHTMAIGGKGNDVLINNGAAGQRFAFYAGDGNDTIINFKTAAAGQAHDYIQLNGLGLNDFASIKAHMTQVGSDVLLQTTATDSILIKGHVISDFIAEDFLTSIDTSKLKLTFSDDFNSLSLYSASNPSGTWKTNFSFGVQNSTSSGWTSRTLTPNGEQEIYVDATVTGNTKTPLGINPFSIDNGILTITATKNTAAQEAALWGYDYSSGLLTTEKSFAQLYGYFEIRADLPTGQGVWPAFWLIPADEHKVAELDVMENINGEDQVYQTMHTNQTGSATTDYFATQVKGLTEGFHTYGMMWTATTITWYIDGVAVGTVATPADMNTPMYLLVNLAVGGTWPGAVDPNFTSADYKIDYVKAYSLDSSTAGTVASGTTGSTSNSTSTGSTTASTGSTGTTTTVATPTYYTAKSTSDKASGTFDSIHSDYTYIMNTTAHELVLTGTSAINGTGNALDNVMYANDAGNKLIGGAGLDTLYGGKGSDTLDGGVGADKMIGGAGDDHYIVDNSGDTVVELAGEGYDDIQSSVTYTLPANVEMLTLTGTANIDGRGGDGGVKIVGNTGVNHLWGGAGNDILDGGKGADIMEGGKGDDSYYVDNSGDKVIELAGEGHDTVYSGITYTLTANVEDLVLIYTGDATGYGNELNNNILGNSGNNKLFGYAGNDTINGGDGNDTIDGGVGNDVLTGGAGVDTFVFNRLSGQDVITDFGNGKDLIDISAYLKSGIKPTIVDGTDGLTINLYGTDSIKLIGVHAGDLVATSTGYALSTAGVAHLMGPSGDHYIYGGG